MKYILLLLFPISVFAGDFLTDLKMLEEKHGVVLNKVYYMKKAVEENLNKSTSPSLIKVYRDNSQNLQDTQEGNFFLQEEQQQIDMLKQQMQKSGGSRVGNGGDIVMCKDNQIEVLDSFRVRKFNSKNLALFKSDKEEPINEVINRLLKSFPHLGQDLQKFYFNFKTRKKFSELVYWSPEAELVNIQDELLMAKLPNNCQLVQAVVRLKTRRKIFFYNQNVFNQLLEQPEQLSWILVHEWLWDYLDNASDLREVNHFLHSSYFHNATEREIMEHLNKLGFKIKESQSYSQIAERKVIFEETIVGLLDEMKSIETSDLAFEQFYAKLAQRLDQIDLSLFESPTFSSLTKNFFKELQLVFKTRLDYITSEGRNQMERGYLTRSLETLLLNDKDLGFYEKLTLFKMGHSTFKIQILSQVGIAKIYVQKRAWFITPRSRDKALGKMNILDEQLARHEISFQQYLKGFFKAMKVKMPNKFKNL